jgi:hypothetical protein
MNAIELLGPAIAAEDNSPKKSASTSNGEDNRFGKFFEEETREPKPEPQEKEIKLPDFAPTFVVQQPLLNVSSMPTPSKTPLLDPGAQSASPLPPSELGHQVERPESNSRLDSTSSRSAETTAEASKPDTGKETQQEDRVSAAKAEAAETEKAAAAKDASADADADADTEADANADADAEESNAAFAAGIEGFTFESEGEGEIADEELQQKLQQAKSNQPAQQQTNTEAPVQTDASVQTKATTAVAAGTGAAGVAASNNNTDRPGRWHYRPIRHTRGKRQRHNRHQRYYGN